MIIVSQDENFIVNFKNVETIGIDKTNGEFYLKCTFPDGNSTLGTFNTEERAEEVLQEIIKAIVYSRKAEEAKNTFGFEFIESNTFYAMPKE